MFLKAHTRTKDGKRHRYYSVVESIRTARGPKHRTLAYLGELNGSSERTWRKTIAVLSRDGSISQMDLFPSDAPDLPQGNGVVRVVLDRVRWERPRDFGEVYLAYHLWRLLGLDELLARLIPGGEEEIAWAVMTFVLAAARLIEPSSELQISQHFYPRTALDDVVGVPEEKVNKDRLYRTLDALLPHKDAICGHLTGRLGTLFREPFDILLYDLTSTYFEGGAEENPLARRGHSRDHRSDCVQIVIGLVVTKGGLPLGYQVFPGNRSDALTLSEMMEKMEALYGKASRIWVFDRGIASEKNLEALRAKSGLYLVGTPRTLLRKVESSLLDGEWRTVREGIEVKRVPVPGGGEDTYVLCRSATRRTKEAAIHDRFEKKMEDGLYKLHKAIECKRLTSRDLLHQKLGRLKQLCSRVARAYTIAVAGDGESLCLSWEKDPVKAAYQRHSEGLYLLRTNLVGESEETLWKMYMQLVDAEAAFRTLKQDLSIRPIHHQYQRRVEAHVLVCFLSYVLYRTLDRLSHDRGLGMTGRKVMEVFQTIKSGDIILPLVDGRELKLRRVSRPDARQAELLARLDVDLPERLGVDAVAETTNAL